MDIETIRLVIVNFPNYLGFFLLYRQQARIIDSLLKMIEHLSETD